MFIDVAMAGRGIPQGKRERGDKYEIKNHFCVCIMYQFFICSISDKRFM